MSAQHSSRVNVILPTADGARTVSCGGKQVCVWTATSGELVWKVDADQYGVDHVLPHSSGCVVSSGSYGTVAVLEGADGRVRHRLEKEQPAGALFELPDGRVLVGDEEYEDLKILDVVSGEAIDLPSEGEQNPVRWIRAHNTTLEALGPSMGLCRYDLAAGTLLGRVMPPDGETCGLLAGDRAISFEGDVLTIWSTNDGGVLHRVDGLTDARGVTPSPDGAVMAVQAKDGVTLIDAARGERLRTITYGPWPRITSFSPDGRVLVVVLGAKGRSSLKVFEVASGNDLGGWDGDQVSTVTVIPGFLLLGRESGNIERLAM